MHSFSVGIIVVYAAATITTSYNYCCCRSLNFYYICKAVYALIPNEFWKEKLFCHGFKNTNVCSSIHVIKNIYNTQYVWHIIFNMLMIS